MERVKSTLASPVLVAVLATVLALAVAVAGAMLLRDAAADADKAAERHRNADAYGVLAEVTQQLQLERVLAQLLNRDGTDVDPTAFQRQVERTDAAVVALATAGAAADTAADLANRLTLIRRSVTTSDESTFEVYSDVVDMLIDDLAQLTAMSRDSRGAADRQARDVLVAAAELLARRRGLVAAALSGAADPADSATRLTLIDRDIDTLLSNARQLVGPESTSDVEQVRDEITPPPVALRAAPESSGAEMRRWLESASADVDRAYDVIAQLNAIELDGADAAAAAARERRVVQAVSLGLIGGLVLAVGAAGVLAARDRRAAMDEHQRVLDGLTAWFHPATFAGVENVEADTAYAPASDHAQAGGDWFDVFELDGMVVAGIGDVTGHGPDAVAHMATLRNVMRGLPEGNASALQQHMTNLDRIAVSVGIMATLLYAIWDPRTAELTYSRAGHLPGVLIEQGRPPVLLGGGTDPLIGFSVASCRSTHTVHAGPGARLVLVTDGIVESPHEHLDVAIQRLVDSLSNLGTGDAEPFVSTESLVARRPDDRDDGAVMILTLGASDGERMGDRPENFVTGRSSPGS